MFFIIIVLILYYHHHHNHRPDKPNLSEAQMIEYPINQFLVAASISTGVILTGTHDESKRGRVKQREREGEKKRERCNIAIQCFPSRNIVQSLIITYCHTYHYDIDIDRIEQKNGKHKGCKPRITSLHTCQSMYTNTSIIYIHNSVTHFFYLTTKVLNTLKLQI